MTDVPSRPASLRAKLAYVSTMRGLMRASRRIGLAGWLERRRDRGRTFHWLSSLGAIYDIDAMVDLDVPWWTYDAIGEVEAFLEDRSARVFEYGSGASTVWLARRAASVVSVEHDADWHPIVARRIAETQGLCPVDYKLIPADGAPASDEIYRSQKPGTKGQSFESYARSIDDAEGPFDVIVIDGRVRQACLRHAARHLAPGGVIVFDNSHRARYRAAIARSDFASRRLRGRVPTLPYPDETTLLTAAP